MAGPYYNKGIKYTVATDANLASLEVALDLDMRTGTLLGETGWLSGNAGGTYPGGASGLAAFTASNSDGNAAGSLRMISLNLGAVTAAAVTITLSSGADTGSGQIDDGTPLTKIVALTGETGGSSVTLTGDLELTVAVGTAGTVTFLIL